MNSKSPTIACENERCHKYLLPEDVRIKITRQLQQNLDPSTCTHLAIVCSWECLQFVVLHFMKEEKEVLIKRITSLLRESSL
jgi:hypothetical protein